MNSRTHFVLVHGLCHGAWCWYKLVTLLQAAGYRVTAMDLGGCGIDPRRLDEIPSMSVSVQPLMELMASLPPVEKVVLVGHSYGGIAISLAMERFPEKISAAVFVTALMPSYKEPPATLLQQLFKRTTWVESLLDSRLEFDGGLENPPTSAIFGPEYMATYLYQHCQPEDLELAKMLVRPGGFFVEDLSKEGLLSEGRFGLVKRIYIVCEEDEVIPEEFQRWTTENSPPQQVMAIAGAAHMAMLSKPKELCLCLQEIAAMSNVVTWNLKRKLVRRSISSLIELRNTQTRKIR
ncbi:salicylic acid-binding protein 2-like isoform X2 [Diospyros lotus]|nr:salicylic acid-binding protein 2-like isoform X2 [Diospyros lotus]